MGFRLFAASGRLTLSKRVKCESERAGDAEGAAAMLEVVAGTAGIG